LLRDAELATPAFVSDLDTLREDARRAGKIAHEAGASALFAMKSYSVVEGLQAIACEVDGFATSSPNEARLARQVLRDDQTVHLTAPGLRAADLARLPQLVDYAGLNSMHQLREAQRAGLTSGLGLRVNPQLSLVRDARYDPCRPSSKLGMPLDALEALLHRNPRHLDAVDGLQLHTHCEGTDLRDLLRTTQHLLDRLAPLWPRLRWANLGGGYLLRHVAHPEALRQAVTALKARGVDEVFIEPGAAVVRHAGFMVSTVVDRFRSGEREVLVLDTTVNHAPEVFEYQFEPWVAGSDAAGHHTYLLAGASCLAGDLFGEHSFREPLTIGDRVVMPEMGSYTHVKASRFNGIDLPSLYAVEGGTLRPLRHFGFDDYLTQCGGTP
jgi:carboxynorspermidine decarboxylase